MFSERLFSLIIAVVEFIVIVVTSVLAILRGRKVTSQDLESLIPFFTRLANDLLGPKTGTAKLKFVLAQIRSECAERHLDYNEEKYAPLVEYYLGADSTSCVSKGGSNEANESSSSVRPSFFRKDG